MRIWDTIPFAFATDLLRRGVRARPSVTPGRRPRAAAVAVATAAAAAAAACAAAATAAGRGGRNGPPAALGATSTTDAPVGPPLAAARALFTGHLEQLRVSLTFDVHVKHTMCKRSVTMYTDTDADNKVPRITF